MTPHLSPVTTTIDNTRSTYWDHEISIIVTPISCRCSAVYRRTQSLNKLLLIEIVTVRLLLSILFY
jgi:hypothetical protein